MFQLLILWRHFLRQAVREMAPLLLHLRDQLLEAHLMDKKFEEILEEYAQTAYLILNQCYVAMQEGQQILQEFGVSLGRRDKALKYFCS